MTLPNNTFLSDELAKIESAIEFRDRINPDISRADIAWHLDHMLKVINGIYHSISQSDPEQFKPDFNFKRKIIFTIGNIPRGKGKSPKSVLPPEKIKTKDIVKQLDQAKENLMNVNSLKKDQYFSHYIFGILNKEKTKRFLEIHTNHHLKIVRDINTN